MTKEIQTREETGMARQDDRSALELIRSAFGAELTEQEMTVFGETCRRTGLDPFARQIYAIKRFDKSRNCKVMAIQTSVDGFRTLALRSGNYKGQRPTQWCGQDGKWRSVWLEKTPPRAAKVEILCAIFSEPLVSVALWDECAQQNHMWRTRGPTMLAKCAEVAGLRRAFPQELSGIYSPDEMPEGATVEAVDAEWTEPERAALPAPKPEMANVDTIAEIEDMLNALGVERDNAVLISRGVAKAMGHNDGRGVPPSDLTVVESVGVLAYLSAALEAKQDRAAKADEVRDVPADHFVNADQQAQITRALNRLRIPHEEWTTVVHAMICEEELMGRDNDNVGEPIPLEEVTDAACGPLVAFMMRQTPRDAGDDESERGNNNAADNGDMGVAT